MPKLKDSGSDKDIKDMTEAELGTAVKNALEVLKKPLDPRIMTAAGQRVDWMVSFLIIRYHFVHQILGMMVKNPKAHFTTMGVSVEPGGRFVLWYDPEWVLELKDEELTYVFYHEILHLALHHCTSRRFDLHHLGNIACDLAVNELIPIQSGSCEPPKKDGKITGCIVSELKKMKEYSDIEEKKSAEWYYDYLRKKNKENGGCDGDCKNCKGKEDKDSPKNKPGNLCGSFDNHDGWGDDEVADERVRAKINEISKSDTWGNVSAADKELIMAAQTRKINWRNILRRFYGNQVSNDREGTRKRPNRRTGYIHPGSKKVQVDKHLVAIDTSGSVDSDLLSQFLATINQMVDYVPIDVMQFDCQKTQDPRPWDRRKHEFTFLGRGGTDFNPVMEVVAERRYKSVLIFTDGQASPPVQPAARVVWVMPPGCKAPVSWGLEVIMEKNI